MPKLEQKVAEMIEKNHFFIIDNAQCGIALVDKDKKFLYCNKKYCELLEYNPSEMMGRSFDDITHPEDKNSENEQRAAVLEGELDGFKMTKRYISKTGKIVWVKLDVRAITFNAERVLEITLAQILSVEDPEMRMALMEYKTQLDQILNDRKANSEKQAKIIGFITVHWQKILIGVGVIIALLGGQGIDVVMKLIHAFTGTP